MEKSKAFRVCTSFLICATSQARLSDLNLKIGRFERGSQNAITDVSGVSVAHKTIIEGDGKLVPGKGPFRTGVTVILPSKGDLWNEKLAAGSFVLNGNGEAMGLMWVQESGLLETPIALTNTLNVSTAQRGVVDWMLKKKPKLGVSDDTFTPLVFECDDSSLNDIQGQPFTAADVANLLDKAPSKFPEEGSVGAGTGMMSYEFKGGIGTSSRKVTIDKKEYTLGVLVNANHGRRNQLRFLGTPLGE